MKKLITLLLAFVLVMSLFAGCKKDDGTVTEETTTPTDEGSSIIDQLGKFEDKVVFTINDKDIMLSSANILLYQIKNYYESYYGPTVWDMEAEAGVLVNDYVKGDIKDVTVRTEILHDIAIQKGLELTEEKKAELVDQAKIVYESYTPEVISKYGFTLEAVQETLINQGYTELVFEEMTKDFTPDEAAIQAELLTNSQYVAMMATGVDSFYDQVRARHILIKTVDDSDQPQPLDEATIAAAKVKAEALLVRAKAGEDFAQLATDNTEDLGSAETGGEYTFGRGQMVPEFEAAAFGLEIGGISDLVETQFGYHIIKLEERIPSTEEQILQAQEEFAGFEDSAVLSLKAKEFDKIYATYIPDYTVTVVEDVWNTMTFRDAVE